MYPLRLELSLGTWKGALDNYPNSTVGEVSLLTRWRLGIWEIYITVLWDGMVRYGCIDLSC